MRLEKHVGEATRSDNAMLFPWVLRDQHAVPGDSAWMEAAELPAPPAPASSAGSAGGASAAASSSHLYGT